MVPFPVANVVIDGELVTGSRPAIVERGTVMTPIDPFVLRFASAVTPADGRGAVVITRGNRWIRIEPGKAGAVVGGTSARLPVAPYVREGSVIVPLAAVARSLGLDVHYDQHSRSAYLSSFAQPVMSMPPFVPPPILPLPRPTFTDQPVETPRPIFTGMPRARRTPIEAGEPPA